MIFSHFMADLFLNQVIGILSLLSVLQVANIFLSSCVIAMLFSLTVSFLYICFTVLNQIVHSFHKRNNISFEYHQERAFQIFQPHIPAKLKRRETCFLGGGQVWILIITGAPTWVASPIPVHMVISKNNQVLIIQHRFWRGRERCWRAVSCCLGGSRENSVAAGGVFSTERTRKGCSAARAEMREKHSEEQRDQVYGADPGVPTHNRWVPLDTPCIFTKNVSSCLSQPGGLLLLTAKIGRLTTTTTCSLHEGTFNTKPQEEQNLKLF